MKAYFYNAVCLALSLGMSANTWANDNRSPRLIGTYDYEIGGYIAQAATRAASQIPSLMDMGGGWDVNLQCGNGDPRISVSNQLNGVTEGFKNMMGDIIQQATGAVASLPALVIQRANPGLYDMLQQGILQAKKDFEFAKTSCEDIAKVLNDKLPFETLKLSDKASNWAQQLAVSDGDAVFAKNNVDDINHGNSGVEWACATRKGGTGQQAIEALTDVVTVGYNVMFERSNACTSDAIPTAEGQGTPLWDYWQSPVDAATWAVSVVGDVELRTCDGCKKMRGVAGKGLMYKHRDMVDELRDKLQDLVDDTTPLTWENLNEVSAPPGVRVSDAVIYAIRKRDIATQARMIEKIASEIAYTRLLEQSRLLTQLLRTGLSEPNVSAFEPAKIAVREAVDKLQVERAQIEQELHTRQSVAREGIISLLLNEESYIRRAITPSQNGGVSVDELGRPQ